jgi:hypothetical protein
VQQGGVEEDQGGEGEPEGGPDQPVVDPRREIPGVVGRVRAVDRGSQREGDRQAAGEPAPGAARPVPGERELEEEAGETQDSPIDQDPSQDRQRPEGETWIEEEDQAGDLGTGEDPVAP